MLESVNSFVLEVVRVGLVTDEMSVLVEAEKMWNHLRLQLTAGRGGEGRGGEGRGGEGRGGEGRGSSQ